MKEEESKENFTQPTVAKLSPKWPPQQQVPSQQQVNMSAGLDAALSTHRVTASQAAFNLLLENRVLLETSG